MQKNKENSFFSFVWICPPFPLPHFVSLCTSSCVVICVSVLEAFNSVEASSNVSLPVEMVAVCSVVVID